MRVKIAAGNVLLVSQRGFDCDRSLLTMHFAFHCKEQIASYFKKISGGQYSSYPLTGFLSLLLDWGLIRCTEAHLICSFYEATNIKFSLIKWIKSLAISNNGAWIRGWGQGGTAQFQCHFEIYDSRWQKKNMFLQTYFCEVYPKHCAKVLPKRFYLNGNTKGVWVTMCSKQYNKVDVLASLSKVLCAGWWW